MEAKSVKWVFKLYSKMNVILMAAHANCGSLAEN